MFANPVLSSVLFPVLTWISYDFEVYSNALLTGISLEALAYFFSNALLSSLVLPVLTFVSLELQVYSNPALVRLQLLALTYVCCQ